MLLHDGERCRRHLVRCNRERRGEHDALHVLVEERVVLCERTANDAVRDKPDELPVRIHHGDRTKPLVRHDKECILCRRMIWHDGILIARMHDIRHGE